MKKRCTEGRRGDESYHILVALFDAKSGKRIDNAIVGAKVSSTGMRGVEKSLELMSEDLPSYGNYFRLERPGRYEIEVEILPKGAKAPVVADFIFVRSSD